MSQIKPMVIAVAADASLQLRMIAQINTPSRTIPVAQESWWARNSPKYSTNHISLTAPLKIAIKSMGIQAKMYFNIQMPHLKLSGFPNEE
jgi:hypothetical protein